MLKKLLLLLSSLMLLFSDLSFANTSLEDSYLLQIINQLEAIQPLILAAEKAQPKNQRVQFHYSEVLTDIEKIKTGIQEKLHHAVIEPRTVSPIKGDYYE